MGNDTDFNAATLAAVKLGMSHVASGKPKLRRLQIADALGFGHIARRNFHDTILCHAYGLAFTNAAKMAYVAKLAAEKGGAQ